MISLVSFGLLQENLVTSTIYSIKPQIMEEVCEVGYKKLWKKIWFEALFSGTNYFSSFSGIKFLLHQI